MSCILFSHEAALAHDTGPGHPECAARHGAVLRALDAPEFAPLQRREAPVAPVQALLAAHDAAHVEDILGRIVPAGGLIHVDPDTVISPGSIEAARRAAGGAMAAVDAVLAGEANSAFVAMRPPGHHAERRRAMGFCLFNNAAVAAFHARDRWGLRRIAVVDFDVHHGNGTQDIFAPDRDLFYASSHQHPCYPGSGLPQERGVANNILNKQLAPGTGSAAFRTAWEAILPELAAFKPELLIVSAGFDAHEADPLAQLRVQVEDFVWLTDRLVEAADAACGGKIVSLLEGGYDLPALAACAAAHLRGLMRL